jgi:hypothetical protein
MPPTSDHHQLSGITHLDHSIMMLQCGPALRTFAATPKSSDI